MTGNDVRAVLFAAAALAMTGCSRTTPAGGKKADRALDRGTVVLHAEGRTVRVGVEVARTPAQRSRGLKYRTKLATHGGMLFIFDRQEVQTFWMQDTYIPLDMIFIDDGLRVVGIVENAEPLTQISRRVEAPSTYVLEVKGGFCRARGIEPGTPVTFEGIELSPRR